MNAILSNLLTKTSPQFNKNVVEGASTEILKGVPEFLDSIFKSSLGSLSPGIDLQYVGFRYLTPKEEFTRMFVKTNKNNDNSKSFYDLAVNDLYMVEYIFKYQNELINRPIYLPFTSPGNLIHFSNTVYSIVPVLSDTVISPSFKEVFVRLLKDKLKFRSSSRNFIINNERLPGQVINVEIVKVNKKQLTDNIGKPLTATALYMVGEYGIREVMKRYIKTDKFIITDENVDHLRDGYNVYESTKIRPKNLKELGYEGHDVKFLIDKSVKITPLIENLLFGLIYTLDILPEHAGDFIKLYNADNVKEEILYWRIMLGRITYQNSYSINRITVDMEEHFDTLQGYLDDLVKMKLSDNGIRVNNFFDLIAVILDNYNYWLINSKEYNSDIKNRYIDILYYLFYDIIAGFNRVVMNINKRNSKKSISYKEINKIFTDELKTRRIYTLVKSQAMNLAIMLAEYTGDIMFPKITALLEDQSRGEGVRRGSKNSFPEATRTVKGPDLFLGNMLFFNKTAPTARLRINL